MSTKSPYTEHNTESTFDDDNAYKMQKTSGENAPSLIDHISATLSTKFSNKPTLMQSLSNKLSNKPKKMVLTDVQSSPLMDSNVQQEPQLITNTYPEPMAQSADFTEQSVRQPRKDIDIAVFSQEQRIAKQKSFHFYLALIALIVSIITLITAIVIAATVIPNLGSKVTSSDTNTGNNDAANLGDNSQTNTNSIIIVNETNRYYHNDTIQYFDVNCSCPTNVYGIINVNKTYHPGGYYGWYYHSSYKMLYPFTDIHAAVGDSILFRSQSWTPHDVWLVSEEVYYECQSANQTGWKKQLAISNEIRSDEPHYGGGYKLLLQNWHVYEWGEILYFASYSGCKDGIKLRVFIEDREVIPVILDDISSLDLSTSETVKDLETSIGHLSRILILQQFSDEQRIRSEGDSGITNVRGYYDGERGYDDGTYSNDGVASIHDHTDFIRVVGIGEISAVLNGVEFQTRHNDYNLNMASRTSGDYHSIEAIPLPDIPPEILNMNNINDEISEMIEYFRAFKYQNKSHRNYDKYFRPILCYLEGAWILSNDNLDEPFDSDRHELDASTWKQLHDKLRWMMNSGRKEPAENLAHLPSSIRNLYNNTYPIISNWEYRILCSPLKNDITTRRFSISNDLHIQLFGSPETRSELYYSRRARFEINKWIDKNNASSDDEIDFNKYWWNEGRKTWNYLDYLMEQIPGKDNYLANLTDELPDGNARTIHFNNNGEYINSGYYSRYYGLSDNDAMGSTKHRRGWSDRYLFAAKTTQKKVSPISFDYEIKSESKFVSTESRWSYAIPLEIIYLTPLTKWNPYNVTYYDSVREFESIHTNQGRSGSCEPGDEYIGWSNNYAYFTPMQFFENKQHESVGADTAKDGICILDKNGISHQVKASGHWITFPSINNGVGKVRQRYPIFPIHYGGSLPYKETKSLQDMILDKENYDDIENGIKFWTQDRDLKYGFTLSLIGGNHEHEIYIPGWKVNYYWYDDINEKYTNGSNYIITEIADIANQHQHTVQIYRYQSTSTQDNNNKWNYYILKCRSGTDSDTDLTLVPYQNNSCSDGHDQLIRDTSDL